jgi:hypothetical protein
MPAKLILYRNSALKQTAKLIYVLVYKVVLSLITGAWKNSRECHFLSRICQKSSTVGTLMVRIFVSRPENWQQNR